MDIDISSYRAFDDPKIPVVPAKLAVETETTGDKASDAASPSVAPVPRPSCDDLETLQRQFQ